MKRPASTKWLLFFSLMLSIVGWSVHVSHIAKFGVHHWSLRFVVWPPISLFTTLTFTTCIILMLRSRPGLFSYISGVLSSLWLCCMIVLVAVQNFRMLSYSDTTGMTGFVIAFILLGGPPFYLFYRFTFGLPSRRFYRVTQR